MAIVGARNASANGRRFAKQLASDLGRAGLVVTSGLARGIDTAAHQGALDSGTVAVLAGGLDVVYPRENAALYDAVRRTWPVVSEMPAGLVPQARHFPAPQPPDLRPVARGPGGRGGAALGLADHRAPARWSRAARSSRCPARPWTPGRAAATT